MATICFAGCKQGRWDSVAFSPLGSDTATFKAQFTVPSFLSDTSGNPQPVVDGNYELAFSCLMGDPGGCAYKTQASLQLHVSAPADIERSVLDWASLPFSRPAAVPLVGGFTDAVSDPTDAGRQVICKAGAYNGREMPDTPHLAITHDGGKTWGRIQLTSPPFTGQHGIAGCRSVALDPHLPDTFYGEDSGNMGGGDGPTQPPYFTLDAGKTWRPVPVPDIIPPRLSGWAFRGFTVAPEGVTAWFSTGTFDQPVIAGSQIAGMLTSDGGHTWQVRPLSCEPGDSPDCARQLATGFLLGQNGLLLSVGGGKTWDWARYAGHPIAALSFWRVGKPGHVLALGGSVNHEFVPLLYSTDAGRTWQAVRVPPLPGGWLSDPAAPLWAFPQMRLLPDGALLAHRWDGQLEDKTWYRLRPGHSDWEQTPPPAPPPDSK